MVAPALTEMCIFEETRAFRLPVTPESLGFGRLAIEGVTSKSREEWNSTIDVYPELKQNPKARLAGSSLYESDSTLIVGSAPALACVTGFSFSYAQRSAAQNGKHPTCKSLKSGRGKGYHAGLDVYIGDSVITAPYAGTVTYSGTQSGYGKRLELLLDGVDYIVAFNHLNTRAVVQGDRVEKGQILGTQGNTGCGNCGVHLHIEVIDARAIPGFKQGTAAINYYGSMLKMHAAGVLCNPWYIFDFSIKHAKKK